MKGLSLLMRNIGVGWYIGERNIFMSVTCVDFYGKKVDSISVAP